MSSEVFLDNGRLYGGFRTDTSSLPNRTANGAVDFHKALIREIQSHGNLMAEESLAFKIVREKG
jgi:hypothetical protein